MNGFLGKLASRVSGTRMQESYIEVLDVLTKLRDFRDEVTVSFEGDQNSYKSMVMALNARHRVMVIENSLPCAPDKAEMRERLKSDLPANKAALAEAFEGRGLYGSYFAEMLEAL